MGALNLRNEFLTQQSSEATSSGNFTYLPSSNVLRAVKYRFKQACVLDQDFYNELRIAQEAYMSSDQGDKIQGFINNFL